MTRAGLSYTDWRAMARWQRQDHLARCQMEMSARAERVQRGGWKEIISIIVNRLIGAV